MSVELVTGYSGVGSGGEPNRHVSSAEDGARQAGTVGLGCYALSTGSKLSATMEDANTLLVSDGDALINGRHVRIPDSLSFTIPTGVQGRRVSNLAVLRYQKATNSVESVTPIVLTGKPSYGVPSDPAYNDGSILDGDSPVDMPLYRVVTNGVSLGTPEPLFDVLLPMSELQKSISRTELVTVASSEWGKVTAWAFGPVVTVSAQWTSSGDPWQDEKVGTLPDGMRPPVELFAPFARDNITQAYGDVCLHVAPSGDVAISGRGGVAPQGDQLQVTLTYVAA